MADEGLSPGSFMPSCSASCVSMHCQRAAHASQHHMLCLIILIIFLGHRHPYHGLSGPKGIPRLRQAFSTTGQISHDCTPCPLGCSLECCRTTPLPHLKTSLLKAPVKWPAMLQADERLSKHQQECSATQCSCEGRNASPRLCAQQSCPWVWGLLHRCQLPPRASTAPCTGILQTGFI